MDEMADASTMTIGFQIKEIRVNSFSINESLLNGGDDIGFSIGLQHLFNPELNEQTVQVKLEAGYTAEQPPLVILQLDCHYQLTGYQEWLLNQSEEYRVPGTLPNGLAMTLNSISISTTRGVLFERLRGTNLQSVVLPIIDPSSFQPVS